MKNTDVVFLRENDNCDSTTYNEKKNYISFNSELRIAVIHSRCKN